MTGVAENDSSTDRILAREVSTVLRGLAGHFEFCRDAGFREIHVSEPSLDLLRSWGTKAGPEPKPRDSFSSLQRDIKASGITGLFYEGTAKARLYFLMSVENSPISDPDEFYATPEGVLFEKILAAMKISRGQVFVCFFDLKGMASIPTGDSVLLGFIRRQVDLIQPECMCTLGDQALSVIVGKPSSVHDFRGRFHRFDTVDLMATYHPELLVRDASRKRDVWEDMKQIMISMGF